MTRVDCGNFFEENGSYKSVRHIFMLIGTEPGQNQSKSLMLQIMLEFKSPVWSGLLTLFGGNWTRSGFFIPTIASNWTGTD